MSDILLGQSYYLRFDKKLWQAMRPYPPLGTLYAASTLRERGYDVALFDAMLADSEAAWAGALDREGPRFAVLYEDNFNYLSKMCLLRMRQAAFTMIDMARERGCTVIACGADASDHAGEYLGAGADFVILGEGEQTLGELMDRLTGRTDVPPDSIAGLAIPRERTGGGSPTSAPFVRTLRRPPIRDLDALPRPAWDLVDVSRYRKIWYERHGYYSMNLVTTRGCPYHCNWCAKPIWGQRYNARSPGDVADELRWLKDRYAPDHIWFGDDIMGLRPGWLAAFADAVEAGGARIPFKCLSRADLLLRDGEVEALRRAGCRTVWMGAESGSQKILDAMEKGIRVEQIRDATRRLREAGIRVGFFLQFGYPGEEREDLEATFQLVRDCLPDDIGISVSYPLPGTPFHERVKEQLGQKRNWSDSEDMAMLYRGPYGTAFYRQVHRVLHREFRLRRGWADLKRWARHPTPPGPRQLGRVARTILHGATLPMERRRLERLARERTDGVRTLPVLLDRRAASTPSPQGRPELDPVAGGAEP